MVTITSSGSASNNKRKSGRSSRSSAPFQMQLLVFGVFGAFCFYAGVLLGTNLSSNQDADCPTSSTTTSEEEIQERIRQEVRKVSKQRLDMSEQQDIAARFPSSIHDFAVGMTLVDRDEFAQRFDHGVPLDPSTTKNKQVLILHSSDKALPDNAFTAKEATSQTKIPVVSVEDATANCDFLNVALTDHSSSSNSRRRQCIALFGQYEAFHLQKWMRLPPPNTTGKALDASLPLRLVNRGAQASGRKSTRPPSDVETRQYWTILTKYLSSLETVLNNLKPVAESVAVNKTIVLLVCNHGQSELLMNFVCSARRRNLDLSAVLVFATDEETRDLAIGLGVHAFYDEINYGNMPKAAAKRYADKNFRAMMMAKVFCVHMVNMLDYNVLFQDVDVIWYRNPLEYFHSEQFGNEWDIAFQDDGNHALYYAPYSANTGFYYVRQNERTRHFFNSFLMAGDLILSTKSHQVPLIALLNEHASMYGLRVKIFSRDGNDFPGGHAYNRRKAFMKDLFAGAVHPYIFHMSWTLSKDNKIRYFQQMGEWFLKEECIQKTAHDILQSRQLDTAKMPLVEPCCAAEPIIVCHYRDKPSKIPCKDKPPIDKGRPSFW